MKKRIFFALPLLVILLLSLISFSAEENLSEELSEDISDEESFGEGTIELDESAGDTERVNKAYDCLKDKIEKKGCESLTTEEKIFSLLSVGKCSSELNAEANGENECWPKGNCDIKLTAQALLAREKAGLSTENAEEWLLKQTATPQELEWFLQIESPKETVCTITYDERNHNTKIKEDKKVDSGAGSCLTLSQNGYWLKISPTCFEKEIEISCNEPFQTNLLYKKRNSVTIYVAENTHSAAASGATSEKVQSYCFGKNSCEYEASLWAASVISYKKSLDEIKHFLPYLMTMAEGNEEVLPESFLYTITGHEDFRNDLLLKQKFNKYWENSGNKFYDTAVALYPFGSETPEQKTKAISWLLDPKTQGQDGCWDNGNIKTNSFLLHSIWPRPVLIAGDKDPNPGCTSSGNYCMSSADCEGTVLRGYDCPGMQVCCDKPLEAPGTCEEKGGKLCSSNEICSGGTSVSSSDSTYSNICCYKGTCQTPVEEFPCESAGGTCSSFGCSDNQEVSSLECGAGTECCMPKLKKESSLAWLWILIFLILIVLVAIGYVYRDKLRMYWSKFKSRKSGGQSSSPSGPRGFPPRGSTQMPMRRPLPRRIIPGNRPPQRSFPPKPQQNNQMDDVLKKLKEMGS
jgi:hypothetical protein